MYRHLITVKVGVECRADEGVQLNSLAFDQHRLKRLNAKAMQRRRAIQHDRMFANDVFENIPDQRLLGLHHFLGGLNGRCSTQHFQLVENERLEQFQRHFLWQPALMQLQRRADHNDGTTGVVHTLAEQVLTEASRFTFDHVSERFQRALVCARHGLATTTVI